MDRLPTVVQALLWLLLILLPLLSPLIMLGVPVRRGSTFQARRTKRCIFNLVLQSSKSNPYNVPYASNQVEGGDES